MKRLPPHARGSSRAFKRPNQTTQPRHTRGSTAVSLARRFGALPRSGRDRPGDAPSPLRDQEALPRERGDRPADAELTRSSPHARGSTESGRMVFHSAPPRRGLTPDRASRNLHVTPHGRGSTGALLDLHPNPDWAGIHHSPRRRSAGCHELPRTRGARPDPEEFHTPRRDGDRRPAPSHQHATSDSSRKPLTPDRQRSISPVHLSTR